MHTQINFWHRNTHQRYGLTELLSTFKKDQVAKVNTFKISKIVNSKNLKFYFNHPFYWSHLQKICLHATSGKLITNNFIYGSFKLAFSCASAQTPKLIKSRQSISAFKLSKASPIALSGLLRHRVLRNFAYKWTWLSAGLNHGVTRPNEVVGSAFGLNNVFIFPELDQLNYYVFEPLPGLEIHPYHEPKVNAYDR